jgi:O-antigen/teichoic acid export membrane protein
MVVPPFVQAFQPRLTTLLAQDRRAEFAHVYRLSVELGLALAVALAGTIAALPVLVMFAWTGDLALGVHLATVLRLYAAGSGVAALLFTPFLLQYAQGRVRLQVIGNLVFGLVWIPAAVWAAFTWGATGTGAVWLIGNLAYLALWVPVIHRRLLSADERRGILAGAWLRGGALAVVLAAVSLIPFDGIGRLGALAVLAAVSLCVFALAVVSAPELRGRALSVVTGRPEREAKA